MLPLFAITFWQSRDVCADFGVFLFIRSFHFCQHRESALFQINAKRMSSSTIERREEAAEKKWMNERQNKLFTRMYLSICLFSESRSRKKKAKNLGSAQKMGKKVVRRAFGFSWPSACLIQYAHQLVTYAKMNFHRIARVKRVRSLLDSFPFIISYWIFYFWIKVWSSISGRCAINVPSSNQIESMLNKFSNLMYSHGSKVSELSLLGVTCTRPDLNCQQQQRKKRFPKSAKAETEWEQKAALYRWSELIRVLYARIKSV